MPHAHDATAERDRGERVAPADARGRSSGPWRWVLGALAGGLVGAVVVVGSSARLGVFATAVAVLFACPIGMAVYAAVDSHRRSAERRREVRRLGAEVDDLLARGERLDSVGEDRAARDRDGRDLADSVAKLRQGEISPRELDEALDRELPEARRRPPRPTLVGETDGLLRSASVRSHGAEPPHWRVPVPTVRRSLSSSATISPTIEGSSKACTVG